MPGVIVFDGVCCLCSRLVEWVIRKDTRNSFKFAPLQSAAGAALLERHGMDPAHAHTMLLVKEGRAYVRSDALIEIARELPGFHATARLLSLVPRRVRDRVYGFVARRRYRCFGKRDTCMAPTGAIRTRFLD